MAKQNKSPMATALLKGMKLICKLIKNSKKRNILRKKNFN